MVAAVLLVLGMLVVVVIIVIIVKYKTKCITKTGGDQLELHQSDPSEKFQGGGEGIGEKHLDNPVYTSTEGCKPLPKPTESLERHLQNPLYDIKMGTKDNQPHIYAVLESDGPEYAVPEALPKLATDSGAATASPVSEATVKHPYDYVEPTTDSGGTTANPVPEVTVEYPHDYVEPTTDSGSASATPVPEASDM